MHTKSTQRDQPKAVSEAAVRSRQSPETASHDPGDTAAALRGLQKSYGNRYVQRMLEPGAARTAESDEETEEPQALAAPTVDFAAASAHSGKPTTIEVHLEPHRGTAAELRALAPFYRAGRTPYFDTEGTLRTFEVAPADASTTAHQLNTIHQRFGDDGIAQTMRGLSLTRGASFASDVIRCASPSVGGSCAAKVDEGETEVTSPVAGRQVAQVMEQSGAGSAVPRDLQRLVGRVTGDRLTDVRVHNDASAHAAADLLNARAFTVGRSIYFAPGEYAPGTAAGRRLLAHELAHTVQQRGAEVPSLDALRVSGKSDIEESHADGVADAVMSGTPLRTRVGRSAGRRFARVQRAVSFKRDSDTFQESKLKVFENAAGFTVSTETAPLFGWFANITINGNAGDPFANFEAGPHQIVRSFRGDFTWGTGASRAKRVLTVSTLPIRDAIKASNTWYHEPFAQAFAAKGDTKFVGLNDSPSPGEQPWTSPVAGKGGTTGSLAFTAAFVAYISARDTTKGTGASAFTALNSLYWNSGISGSFDTSKVVGSRVTASGGKVNKGGIISGGAAEFPSMHGGAIANDSFTTTDT